MTGQAAGPVWPSASPPPAVARAHLEPAGRRRAARASAPQLRRHAAPGPPTAPDADLRDQLVLALDEMASNALRHGGGEVRATVRLTDDAYLIEVSDQARRAPRRPRPSAATPARAASGSTSSPRWPPSTAGTSSDGHKYVWALLPRG